jgi:5,10-methylene-tetrahydrofolate dehydrogenase/methenyl tetrahydrofolate cyclohydrolase
MQSTTPMIMLEPRRTATAAVTCHRAAAASMQGTVSIVTGASRGIGKGIATELAKAGSTVYITGTAQLPRPSGRTGMHVI